MALPRRFALAGGPTMEADVTDRTDTDATHILAATYILAATM